MGSVSLVFLTNPKSKTWGFLVFKEKMIKKYVLFGTRGSYHHQVAMAVFGEIDSSGLIFVDTFEKVVEHVMKGAYSVLAIQNSTIGAVAQNRQLLEKNSDKLEIIEYFDLPIQHCLVGLKNSNLDE